MWRRGETVEVLELLERDMMALHPEHRTALMKALIPARRIPVADCPGESVVAVASVNGKLLYWSDVEGGWELEMPSPSGGIRSRGCNQFELGHIAYQAFGEPSAA
jgi:hypothetical protein